jgi:hypothetical protein
VALSAPTSLASIDSGGGHGTGAEVISGVDPPDASLIVVALGSMQNGGSGSHAASLTISGGGLTWTKAVQIGGSGAWNVASTIWTAPFTSGAAFDITLDCGSVDIYRYQGGVYYLTGYNTGTPTGATASDASLSVNQSMTLSGTPASTSQVIGVIAVDTSSDPIDPGSGWTELHEVGAPDDNLVTETQHRGGSTSTTVAWQNPDNGFGGNCVAVEILEGSSGTSANAEAAAATGTSNSATTAVAPTSSDAAATGTANDATVTTDTATNAQAETATATGEAFSPFAPSVAPTAETIIGSGVADNPTTAVAPNVEAASATGTANDATVTTGSFTNANAEAASGTGTANDPTLAVAPVTDTPTGTGTAYFDATGGGIDLTLQAEDALYAVGTANDATPTVAPVVGSASATGVANDATVSAVGSGTNAQAESAAATGTADDATTKVSPSIQSASATGAAFDATTTSVTTAAAGAASATGAAHDATTQAATALYFEAEGYGVAYDATVVTAAQVWRLILPTRNASWLPGETGLQNRLGRILGQDRSIGVSVLKIDGTYVAVVHPTTDQIAAATEHYLGGHVYEVDVDTANAWIADGFEAIEV